ncbi:YHS domain-containing (seleno)protein [Ningiella sp. W23]|uniref:YHS domain-containing (seleno)protein n=1 Tax=Ningiella sp. W23 TaxID=3023715 RepID=UPI0037569399
MSLPSKKLTIATLFIAFVLTSCGLIPSQSNSSLEAVNVDESGVAIKGYDPVAYFTVSEPTKGSQQYSAKHNGATYYFASEENQSLFESAPDNYAPQYGGYCAFGVTQEKKYDVDPTAWAVVDGKLYLNLNAGAQRVWDKDRTGNIETGNDIWLDIENKSIAEL